MTLQHDCMPAHSVTYIDCAKDMLGAQSWSCLHVCGHEMYIYIIRGVLNFYIYVISSLLCA